MTTTIINETKKENIYKELCEMGKLGMDVNYPHSFRYLERCNVESFECISDSEVADQIIHLSRVN